MDERNNIDLNSPRERLGFGIMFAGVFVALTYLANLGYQEDLDAADALHAQTHDVGRAAPADVPENTPVLLTLDISGETRLCDQDLGHCLSAVIYARDVETRVRERTIVTDTRNGQRATYTDRNVVWSDDGYNPDINPAPFPGLEYARAISDDISTSPAYRLSEEAVDALIHRPDAVLTDADIDPAETRLGYAGDGWWRPNAPGGAEIGEQRMRVRTIPAGTYSFLGAVSDGIVRPVTIDDRRVLLARAGTPDLVELIGEEAPSVWGLVGKVAFLSVFMAIGILFMVTAFIHHRGVVVTLTLLVTVGINAGISFFAF